MKSLLCYIYITYLNITFLQDKKQGIAKNVAISPSYFIYFYLPVIIWCQIKGSFANAQDDTKLVILNVVKNLFAIYLL